MGAAAPPPPRPRSPREAAPAKINLALHVRRRRRDGFHDIETVFAFLDIGDELSCTHEPDAPFAFELVVHGPFAADLPTNPSNLVLRAARLLHDHAAAATTPLPTGLHRLHLRKSLPVASGLGGGSADAAAALRLLDRLWDLRLPLAELAALAAAIGSDVPACVHAATMLGTGRGEQLSPLPDLVRGGEPLLLVNPGVAVETGPVFAAWDGRDLGPLDLGLPAPGPQDGARDSGTQDLGPPNPGRFDPVPFDPGLPAFDPLRLVPPRLLPPRPGAPGPDTRTRAPDLLALALTSRNDLEPGACRRYPVIATALETLAAAPGARLARMSGSGATCFALFGDPAARDAAAAGLRAARPGWWIAEAQLLGDAASARFSTETAGFFRAR